MRKMNKFKQLFRTAAAFITALSLAVTSAAVYDTPAGGYDAAPAAAEAFYPTTDLPGGVGYVIDAEEYERINSIVEADYAAYYEQLAEDGVTPGTSDSDTVAPLSNYNFSASYYYSLLNTNEKQLYDNIKAACDEFAASSINLSSQEFCSTASYSGIPDYRRALRIYFAFYWENPQYYFLNDEVYVSYGSSGGNLILSVASGFQSASKRETYSTTINSVTTSWMPEIKAAATPLAKEEVIYKKLTDSIDYVYGTYDQTIAGALVDRKCVCNGYALAAAYFLNAVGIESFVVVGNDHAWNMVQLYGNWYELDVTWYDTGGLDEDWINKSHATFLKNDQDGAHVYDSSYYPSPFKLPSATRDTVEIPEHYGELTVTFVNSKGKNSTAYVKSGETAVRPTDPTMEGFVFKGWSLSSKGTEEFDFGTPITKNIKLYAIWEEIPAVPCTITFTDTLGDNNSTVVVNSGKAVTAPAVTNPEGYGFVGWYTEDDGGEKYDFAKPVLGDMTLYARWRAYTDYPVYTYSNDLGGFENLTDAFKAVNDKKDTAASYTFYATQDLEESKLTIPAKAKSVTVDLGGHTAVLAQTSLTFKTDLSVMNGTVKAGSAKGTLTIKTGAKKLSMTDVRFSGTAITLQNSSDMVLDGISGLTLLTLKGGSKGSLLLDTDGNTVILDSVSGFGKVKLIGLVTLERSMNVTDLEIGSEDVEISLLVLDKKAALTVKGTLGSAGSLSAISYANEDFKPITLKGKVTGKFKLVSTYDLVGKQVFNAKDSSIADAFDIVGDWQDDYSADTLFWSKGTKVYVKEYSIECEDNVFAEWSDLLAYIKKNGTADKPVEIKLLDDYYSSAALKLPAAKNGKTVTINGAGHTLSFKGTSVKLVVPTTLADITMTSVKIKNGVTENVKWTLTKTVKKTDLLTMDDTVTLTNCVTK